MNPAVFIIMPVYNREFSLRRSVNSILQQGYKNWKLLIVDDNSTDGSPEIIQDLMAQDDRISTTKNTQYSHSTAGARLTGIDAIEGDYVAFLDSDDEWPGYHLEHFVSVLEDNTEIDFIFGDIQRLDTEGNIITRSKFVDEKGLPDCLNIDWNNEIGLINDNDAVKKAILTRFNTGMHTALFKNNFLERVKLRDVYGCEDALFTLEALYSGASIAVSRDIHLHYLVHDQNVSSVNASNNYNLLLKNCETEIKFLKEYIPKYIDLSTDENKALIERLSQIYVWQLGNVVYREYGYKWKALKSIFRGIALCPENPLYWKTLFGTLVK